MRSLKEIDQVDGLSQPDGRGSRFIEKIHGENSDYYVFEGITDDQIEQLISYSLDDRDEDVQRFTHDRERFGSREAFDAWRAKDRTIVTLADELGALRGIAWFGGRQMPQADYFMTIKTEEFPYTQAIRMYGKARGQHLAVRSAVIAGQHFKNKVGTNAASGIWVDRVVDNAKLIETLQKANPGLSVVSSPNADNRVVMVSREIVGNNLTP